MNLRGMVLDQGVASACQRFQDGRRASGRRRHDGDGAGEPGHHGHRGRGRILHLARTPEGNFTLIFKSAGGAVLGTLSFSQVKPNQEITITVQVTGAASC